MTGTVYLERNHGPQEAQARIPQEGGPEEEVEEAQEEREEGAEAQEVQEEEAPQFQVESRTVGWGRVCVHTVRFRGVYVGIW